MKKSSILLAITLVITLLISGCGENSEKQDIYKISSAESQFISAVVTRVVDGDTVIVSTDTNPKERVRFIGVNTPESTKRIEVYGKEASRYTKEQLTGKKVYLEIDAGKRDKYGRLLAYIWLEQPSEINEKEIRKKMYNAQLLIEGYAQQMTVPPNVKYVDLFTKYQREARDGNRGLWKLKPVEKVQN